MDMAERDFCQASLEYVFQLQAVQERKKFELVETLLGFVFGWWTFHHTAHDVHADAEPRVKDLQLRIQRVSTCARVYVCACVCACVSVCAPTNSPPAACRRAATSRR